MSDWPNEDARACHDYAIHALQAKQFGVAIRHAGKGQPIEVMVYCREHGKWMTVEIESRRALQLAEKLLAAGLTEIA